MIKSKLLKAVMLGVCLSAFSTSIAFAQMNTGAGSTEAGVATVTEATLSPELEALYAKQSEIDQYIFTDHAKEIEEKGIFVNYTGVNADVIEIGITPFTDENANYFYDIFGKDLIKVVEFDQSVIYESTVVLSDPVTTDSAVTDSTGTDVSPDKGEIYETTAADTADGKVYKDGDPEMQIQIESVDPAQDTDSDAIYYTTADAADQAAADVKTVSAAENPEAVKRGNEEDSNGVSTPMMVLIIAAGAAVIGGSVLLSSKKKNSK